MLYSQHSKILAISNTIRYCQNLAKLVILNSSILFIIVQTLAKYLISLQLRILMILTPFDLFLGNCQPFPSCLYPL